VTLEISKGTFVMLDRRDFLRFSGGAGALALSSPFGSAFGRSTAFATPLPIPPLLEGDVKDGRRIYELKVQEGMSRFIAGYETPTIGVNGAFLGPTIRCKVGDQVRLQVSNALGEPTTVHWHGLHLPARFDGGPHQTVPPGGVWEPEFLIKQEPSLCWYHSHLMGRTGEQVLRGLAGLFLIAPEDAAEGGLPHDYGVDDIPLVLQDRRFRSTGAFDYGRSMHDLMMGYHGDAFLVNGSISPFVDIRRRQTRLRILNGSNARIYNLGFDDGRAFAVIGGDGSLLERPVRQRMLRLAPGERAEIIVDMQSNVTARLATYPLALFQPAASQGATLVELRAGSLEGDLQPLASKLTRVPAWNPETAHRVRSFELQMGMMGMMGMGPGGGMMRRGMGMGRGGMMGHGAMVINGRSMDPDYINERVNLGAIEIWEIRNPTPLPHPFHIHNVQFRILDRDGRAPLPQESGLKDTVLVESRSMVRAIMEFTDYADPERPYMYHCHNLEHEDAGMMGQFVVA
jgi:FtsP/CotA-like multicopper oxidase with cupredoxin domain